MVVIFVASSHHEVDAKACQEQDESRQRANDDTDVGVRHVAMVMRLVTNADGCGVHGRNWMAK